MVKAGPAEENGYVFTNIEGRKGILHMQRSYKELEIESFHMIPLQKEAQNSKRANERKQAALLEKAHLSPFFLKPRFAFCSY